jgi:transcriptional regulator with XRE-family HTH domain
MAVQKLYAGAKLRELRGRLTLTQRAFADKLGVSLPYLNQMENNHRPVSASVVLALAQEFGLDVTELNAGEGERLVSDMREALADPVFSKTTPPLPAPFWTCTAPIGKAMNAWLPWMRLWAAMTPRSAQARGKRCATSFTIATITSMQWTVLRNIS